MYKRKLEDTRRLIKLSNATKNSVGAGAYFDTDKNRYIRFTIKGNSKYWKKVSNKKFRKNLKVKSGSNYKRVLPYSDILY